MAASPSPAQQVTDALAGAGGSAFRHLNPSEQVLAFVIAAPVIYLLMVLIGRGLKRGAGVQLGVMYKFFGASLALYIPMKVLRWDYGQHPYELRRDLRALVVLLGVIFGLSLMRRFLWEIYFGEKRRMEIPKFLREIFSAILFCVALLLVVSRVYDIPPSGLVLSSTVLVGVIGWAMQDLLGNVISGVALQVGKPFKAGDWLIIEAQHAEVIEVNWRSTRLRTNDDHYLDVPNTAIVRSTIVNLSYPSHLHAMRVRVGVVYDAAPNKVKQVLLEAAMGAPGVLSHPPVKVFLVEFADSAVTYEVKYWMQNHAAYNEISDALRTRVWYGLKRAGIGIPFPIRTVQIERKRPAAYKLPEETRALIRGKPFFKCLTAQQMSQILDAAAFLLFGRGERMVEQGEEGSSMFILMKGDAGVYVRPENHGGEPTQVATLHAGDYFGEMSLLTGEARSATITAATDCEVLEIAKGQMALILQENSELMKSLSEMLAQRRLDNEGVLASTAEQHGMVRKKQEYAQGFLRKLAAVFEL
jgi:small-conductance mechanosensitive channel/CRP-like cAMP-binding protein